MGRPPGAPLGFMENMRSALLLPALLRWEQPPLLFHCLILVRLAASLTVIERRSGIGSWRR
jgi:hypothetical protein